MAVVVVHCSRCEQQQQTVTTETNTGNIASPWVQRGLDHQRGAEDTAFRVTMEFYHWEEVKQTETPKPLRQRVTVFNYRVLIYQMIDTTGLAAAGRKVQWREGFENTKMWFVLLNRTKDAFGKMISGSLQRLSSSESFSKKARIAIFQLQDLWSTKLLILRLIFKLLFNQELKPFQQNLWC